MLTAGAAGLAAAACIASAADRLGAQATPLPARLAPRAALEAARRAVLAGDPRASQALAMAAVAANPIDADALALLGAAAIGGRDAATTHAAFTTSAQLGWRNPATQLYWLGVALQLDEHAIAAERLDALLRTGARSPATDAALARLEASPAGRTALAARLAEAPDWSDAFATEAGSLTGAALDRRIAVLGLARAAGMKGGCRAVAAPTRALVARGAVAAAERLWRTTCAAGAAGLHGLRNGGFEAVAGERFGTPFEWHHPSGGDLDVTVAPAPAPLRGGALRVAMQGGTPRIVAAQAVALAPGNYRIAARVIDGDGRPSRAASAALACLDRRGSTDRAIRRVALPGRVTVSGDGCALHELRLIADPQRIGASRLLWIDDVSIRAEAVRTPVEAPRRRAVPAGEERRTGYQGGAA